MYAREMNEIIETISSDFDDGERTRRPTTTSSPKKLRRICMAYSIFSVVVRLIASLTKPRVFCSRFAAPVSDNALRLTPWFSRVWRFSDDPLISLP